MTGLKHYPLFVALTRAPMFMGVTQTFFVFNFVPCFCFLLLTKNFILPVAGFLILHIAAVILCAHDERFAEIVLGKLSLACPNKNFWGCNSYDPE